VTPSLSGRTLLRGIAVGAALALLVLWVFLVRYLVIESQFQPAPGVLMLPILFFTLAVWAAVGAVRDESVVVLLAGALSLVPVGIFLLFMPSFPRWIGILDLGLVAVGCVLLATDPGGEAEAEPGISPGPDGPSSGLTG
jgi:hypothetical protein